MTHRKALLRLVLGVMGLLMLAPQYMGCQTAPERNTLKAIEKSIHGIVQQVGNAVVVVDLVTYPRQQSAIDSSKSESRFGSGFVYSSDGIIVTTDGLIGTADEIWVINQKGDRLPATVIGRDFETNVGVLRVEDSNLPAIPLMDSSITSGCLGIMIGNTYYSEGLCCAWGMVNCTWIGGGDFLDQKLFSIHIHWPEVHSGTPVLDVSGRLIGMAEGHLEKAESTWTLIPATTIKAVAERLILDGSITRGWLGIRSNPVCPREKTARLMKQWKGKGAVVSSVVTDSPADRAGIKIGDVVVKCNGQPVLCISDIRGAVTAMPPGTNVVLIINRSGDEITLDITLSSMPADPDRQRRCIKRSA